MFKATPPLQKMLRRLPLSPKQAGKEYYKGNRVGSMGIINRYGNFIPDWNKIRTFVYPQRDIKLTDLTPFVAESIEKVRYTEADNPENYPKRFGGEEYLKAWKLNGGHDIVEQESAVGGVIKSRRTNMPTPFEEKPATKS